MDAAKQNETVGDILEKLTNFHYDAAKTWGGWHLAIEVVVYVAGIVAVFAPSLPLEYPAVALLLILVTLWVGARVDACKEIAEMLKREHEYWQGFGIPPSQGRLADLRVRIVKSLPQDLEALLREGLKFSSSRAYGPGRVIENLSESAWYSTHLAGWCSEMLRALFVASVVVAVVMLLIVAESVSGKPVGTAAAKCVSSTLAFLISVGVLRSWLSFNRFSREASSFEAEAQRLLKAGSVPQFEAQRLLAEYQLLRATSPLIPTWVWKRRRNALERAWNELKRPTD